RFEDPSRNASADNGSQRTADSNDGKQSLALLFGVNVVRKRPKLRDQHHVEQADPKKKCDTQVELHASKKIENHEVRHKKGRHSVDQTNTVGAAGEGAIQRHQQKKQNGLTRAGIAFDFSSGASQDESL